MRNVNWWYENVVNQIKIFRIGSGIKHQLTCHVICRVKNNEDPPVVWIRHGISRHRPRKTWPQTWQ